MLFNSIDFAIFLPLVFTLYWIIPKEKIRAQNLLLLFASYIFYGWWDWRFLSLIIISSVIDYFVGINLAKESAPKKKKILLLCSLIANLGFLGFFKYFNFFADNFVEAFTLFGVNFEPSRLKIILPVGISFYTFQTLSYSIDIYRKKLGPTKDAIAFFSYVSFFPQLVAGPIERAVNLLPQFHKERTFNYSVAVDGLRQMLWGFFKKIVIADNCAILVNDIFGNYADYPGSTLLLGAVLFAFQIYGDFSGYSDIAIGTARLFGFNLMQNFAFPYFSRDIAEFWRRWHISLSTWFRDYLYIPLGGSRVGQFKRIRNTLIIFVVSGFWHGANWTFIVWGFLHAIYFIPLLLTKQNRKNIKAIEADRKIPSLRELFGIFVTFFLVVIAWIFFRAENVSEALQYIRIIFSRSLFEFPRLEIGFIILPIIILVLMEWRNRQQLHALASISLPKQLYARWGLYFGIGIFILFYLKESQTFIYFQF